MKRAGLVGLAMVTMILMTAGPAAGARNGPILFSDYTSIWKVKPNGMGLKRVAKKRAWSLHASPNGRQLLYTHSGLYRIPIGGGKSVNLLRRYPIVDNMAGVNWASWSPNGKKIAFAGDNDSRIYIMNANGTNLRYLFPKSKTGFRHPVWSPNGREIAYIDVWNDVSIMAINLRTGKKRKIYPGSGVAGTATSFDWHPSGKRIAFYAPYGNWMINSNGKGLREIAPENSFESYEDVVFSPDGKEILARALPTGGLTSEIWRLHGYFGALPSGFVKPVTSKFRGSAFFPEWAPRRR